MISGHASIRKIKIKSANGGPAETFSLARVGSQSLMKSANLSYIDSLTCTSYALPDTIPL